MSLRGLWMEIDISAQMLDACSYVMCFWNGGISIAGRAIQIYCGYVVIGVTRLCLLAQVGGG
jgi:hypothetical protein